MNRRAIITSIKGTKLSTKEKALIKKYKPWGIIIFKRNVETFTQLKHLINSIKKCMNDPNYPVLIDEEGGPVSRLSDIYYTRMFSQKFFGELYSKNKKVALSLYQKYLEHLSTKLKELNININTIPVLDLLHSKTHKFLSQRSYSTRVVTVEALGKFCVSVLKRNKVAAVVKHFPGHGLSTVDSHYKLPVINENLKFLLNNDFKCFKNSSALFAMTGHILIKALDKDNCITFSKRGLAYLRKKLKFKGLIISDDISMKALSGNYLTNSQKALAAGCNLSLYCAGKTKESENLLKMTPYIDSFTIKKTKQFYNFLR